MVIDVADDHRESEDPDLQSASWPFTLSLKEESLPSLQLFGQPLHLTLRGGPTLELSGESPHSTRLIALPKTSSTLSFLPSFGDRSLLLFPRPQLLCPAGVRMKVHLALSLQLQLFVDTRQDSALLTEWTPPLTSRGAYGPVDSAEICTSQQTPAAPLQERLQERYVDHPILNLRLALTNPAAEPRSFPAWARIPLDIVNTTSIPLEISKIMVPTMNLGLFQYPGEPLSTNPLTMRLLSPQEAELLIEGHPDPRREDQWQRLCGKPVPSSERKPYVFLYTYRTKTGLEHGF